MVEMEAIVGHAKLHARPAALLVQRAKQFDSEVKLEKEGKKNAKSAMGIMAPGVVEGDAVKDHCRRPRRGGRGLGARGVRLWGELS